MEPSLYQKILTKHHLIWAKNQVPDKANLERFVNQKTKESYFLKTGHFNSWEAEITKFASTKNYYFQVPKIVDQGKNWFLIKEVEGKFLNDFYDTDLEKVVKIQNKVSKEYQKLIADFLKVKPLKLDFKKNGEWLKNNLKKWSQSLIEKEMISTAEIEKLETELLNLIEKEKALGWVHGNIIGDHIILKGDKVFLIDLGVNLRPASSYYDFLRGLDFLILKSPLTDEIEEKFLVWIKKYLPEQNFQEVKLVMAFRAIGVLGWDLLVHGDPGFCPQKGDRSKKFKFLLKLIKRNYQI